jgi:hypothetical protein
MLALCWKVKQGLSSGGDLGLSENSFITASPEHQRAICSIVRTLAGSSGETIGEPSLEPQELY